MSSEMIEFLVRLVFFEIMYMAGYLIGYRQGKNDGGGGNGSRRYS